MLDSNGEGTLPYIFWVSREVLSRKYHLCYEGKKRAVLAEKKTGGPGRYNGRLGRWKDIVEGERYTKRDRGNLRESGDADMYVNLNALYLFSV